LRERIEEAALIVLGLTIAALEAIGEYTGILVGSVRKGFTQGIAATRSDDDVRPAS
jgi:hypothetical protein